MTETLESETSRRALARRHGLIDLGHLPERIRRVAGFWGGTTTGARAIYELAQRDGLVTSVDELRAEIGSVHDLKVRNELLVWLESRAR